MIRRSRVRELLPEEMISIAKRAMWLAIPLAVSSAAWIFKFEILDNAPNASIEGDSYLALFVGTISFVLTGPLTGIILSRPMLGGKMIGFWTFAALLFLTGVPAISFEMISYSLSTLNSFLPRELCTDADLRCLGATGTVSACVYAVYSLIMYLQGRRGVKQATVAALLLVFVSLALFVMRFIAH